MRKTLIASSVAALAVGVVAGGAAFAIESGVAPATPTTTPPGLDVLTGMGLEPEQIECLIANFGTFDLNDPTAMSEMLTECAVSTDELQIDEDATETTLSDDTVTSAVGTGEIDAATAAAVLALLGLDSTTVDCIVAEVDDMTPSDEPTAEAVFITCGVGPLQVLNAIVALEAAGSAAVPDDTTIETLAPTISDGSASAFVDQLLTTLETFGITVDDEQRECLVDNADELDPSDLGASLAVLESCGVEVADLLPGG